MKILLKASLFMFAALFGSAHATSALGLNESLIPTQSLISRDGQYSLRLQLDGNLVLRNSSGKPLWASSTVAEKARRLALSSDGDLILHNASGAAVWRTGTAGSMATKVVMQNDGNLVMLTSTGRPVWSTRTNVPKPDDTVKPIITLNGGGSMFVALGSKFTDPGASAVDDRDGNLSNSVVVSGNVNTGHAGSYVLSYNVKDKAGNAATTVTRTVTVTSAKLDDTVKPIITLNGGGSMFVALGSKFTDPGASAVDDRDGNLSSSVVVSGNVNIGHAGSYVLSYNVKDKAGNAATTVTRTVTVASVAVSGTKLPIEVLGPGGTAVSVTFNLRNVATVTHLYLRCNSCGYEDVADNRNAQLTKAYVRINGGNSISLKHFIDDNGVVIGNKDITVIGGEAKYGGIGGAFRTTRFTLKIPANQLRVGSNTLTFEHMNPRPPSIGYRIIDLNFIENGDFNRKSLVSNADLVMDDPVQWTAPRPHEVQAGAALWVKRDVLYDPLLDALDGPGGRVTGRIRASCADCHTKSGRDLKFFNFSNHSIVQRSVYHGLTKTQGEQIASYIRSNSIPVTRRASPWNPTYQPGPQLDSNSTTYEWAAGAGIDAVLDDDKDIARYLFPGHNADNPPSLNEVRRVVNRFGKLNLRELPINIPMPEWNQWLPVVHPDDAFDINSAVIKRAPGGANLGKPYYAKIVDDAMANPSFENLGFANDLKSWLGQGANCQSNGPGSGEPWRSINGDVLQAMTLPAPIVTESNCANFSREKLKSIEYAKRGLSAWASVKMWEIMHGQALEESSRRRGNRVCIGGTCVDASETRGWSADGRNVFDRTPHFTAVSGNRRYLYQSEMQGIFDSNQWYHLNMILNPGYRVDQPSHFAYTYSHIELLHQYSKVPQGFRFWATMIKQRQLQTTGRYGVEEGLDLRTAQPHIYFGTARDRTSTRTQGSVGPIYWPRFAQAMLEDLVADAKNTSWERDWSKANQNRAVQPPSASANNFKACSGVCEFDIGPSQGSNTYKVIPELRNIGVEESALNDLISWSKTMWPRGNWDALRDR